MTNVPTEFAGDNQFGDDQVFNVQDLFSIITDATASAKIKLQEIKDQKSAISIGDMFEMQMLMNHLSQLSDMSTSVVSASHQAISTMARNVKG